MCNFESFRDEIKGCWKKKITNLHCVKYAKSFYDKTIRLLFKQCKMYFLFIYLLLLVFILHQHVF